ncbi:MAG: S1 RNA-binding domain-containing protein [Lachnospiraceae bacterium]|nr:S1 RNA-binding domain-containing protein [Lachnospiraceae bacterium]
MELGKRQKLVIIKVVDFGVYLASDMNNQEDKVLLPKKQIPDNKTVGDSLDVFIYRDSKDRLIATTNQPKLTLGDVAKLTVAQVGKIGAFLDWGLEKDLFLPFKEQTRKLQPGDEVLAALYIDKSNRLCATMKVYPYLNKDSAYQKDDKVSGMIYEISQQFGAFVAVDDMYSALIPKKELYGPIAVGDYVTARVTSVKEDGKLDLSLREKAYIQIGADSEKVLEKIKSNGGKLDFNDKAAPELIREQMNMSKNEFKRAVGHLLKERHITIEVDGIYLNANNKEKQ